MDAVLERIDTWERAGLIDAATAARLRAAESDRPVDPPDRDVTATRAATVADRPRHLTLANVFGPGVTVGEMFAYLGVGFLLGAWSAFLLRIAGGNDHDFVLTGGTAAAAAAMFGLGAFLAGGEARRRRAAGAAFLVTTGLAGSAAAFLVQHWNQSGPATGVFIAGVAAVVAVILRFLLPAVTTQVGLLGALTGLTAAVLSALEQAIHPPFDGFNGSDPEPVGVVLVGGAAWLALALGLGFLGLFEANRAATDPAASRRAAITRFWAGLVAVIGLATALTRSGYLGGEQYGRLLEPWIADVALLVLAAILVERAFRRDAAAFIVSAAIALIVALTDFNFSYLSQSTDVGLLLEGVILLAVGFVGDRLRRRLDRSPWSAPVGTDDSEVAPA